MRLLLVAVVGSAWLVATASQVRVARDEVSVWQRAVTVAALKPRPWVNLGTQYVLRGDLVRAEDAYRVALRLAEVRPAEERAMTGQVIAENRARMAVDIQQWISDTR